MQNPTNQNPLYPVFLKLHELELLLVGAGEAGYEKLFFILKSSPSAIVTVVAPEVSPRIEALLSQKPGHKVTVHRRSFEKTDPMGCDVVIAATNDHRLNAHVREAAKSQGALVNVADTPDLCDFYLGGVVTKGDLKIAISTNGRSPTFAKRLRQVLEEALPGNTNNLLQNLHKLRARLSLDFSQKVEKLNELTANLVA
jgi:precorrin-2 dehydrogenase